MLRCCFFYLLFCLFLFWNPTSSESLVAKSCSDLSNYTTNSTFEANLNFFLYSYSNHFSSTGYKNATAGSGANAVYGLYLCRGDATPDTCHSCVVSAAGEIKRQCPKKKSAKTWYNHCYLRYSEHRFFSKVDSAAMVYQTNAQNATDAARFGRVVKALLANVSSAAANSTALFAAGEANFTSTQMVYALAQCTRDLSASDCRFCLEAAISNFSVCCSGKQGGRLLGGSCNLRYEVYPFVEEGLTVAGPLPSAIAPITALINTTATSSSKSTSASGKKRISSLLVAIVVPVGVATLLVSFTLSAWMMRKQRGENKTMHEIRHQMGEMESLQFELATIKDATNNFSDANKLGQGGFGVVYKGKLPDGQEIAVKRLFKSSRQGLEEFKNEVALVAKLQHKNLVRLLGCCLEGEEQILIFEYVPNQSLDYFIFDPLKCVCFCWEKRYKVICGIARGLLYLHEDSRLKIIHRDLKLGNVLLDEEMNPKISDFGTAKLFEVGQTQGNTSRITGTYGYMSPEYAMHGKFSIKSDVFSFGVLVLEVVSGLKSSGFFQSELAEDLPSYAWRHWNEGTITDLIDKTLLDSCCLEEVIRCIHIGLLCVQEKVVDRPSMSSVVLMLNKDSVTLPPPLPPVFSNSNGGEELDCGSTTSELDQSSRNLLHLSVNGDTSFVELEALQE